MKNLIGQHKFNVTDIEGIGISGTTPSLVMIDKKGKPLGNSIIWMDRRAVKEDQEIGQIIGRNRIYNLGGHRLDPSVTLAKILWIKKYKPRLYESTYKFLSSNGFLAFKFTNEIYMDYTQAATGLLLEIHKMNWAIDVFKQLGMDINKMPELCYSTQVIGEISSDAAKETGLKKGTPVIAGAADGSCGAIGVGVIEPGTLCNVAGTTDVYILSSNEPIFDLQMRFCCAPSPIPKIWNVWSAISTSGAIIKWYLENFGAPESVCKEVKVDIHKILDFQVKKSKVGANGLILLPYFMGERSPIWDPKVRGLIFGLTLAHKREDIIRAIYEGIAFSLRHNIETFEENGICINDIVMAGGAAKSQTFCKIRADITGKRVIVPKIKEPSALGAAFLAGIGTKYYKEPIKELKRLVRNRSKYNPDLRNFQVYSKLYEVYRKLSNISIEISNTFNNLTK
jgi:xylulokinase